VKSFKVLSLIVDAITLLGAVSFALTIAFETLTSKSPPKSQKIAAVVELHNLDTIILRTEIERHLNI
jgi:hypothetical protein